MSTQYHYPRQSVDRTETVRRLRVAYRLNQPPHVPWLQLVAANVGLLLLYVAPAAVLVTYVFWRFPW